MIEGRGPPETRMSHPLGRNPREGGVGGGGEAMQTGKADSEMTMAMLMAMPMTATVVVTATEQLTVLVTVPLGQTVLLRAPWRA